MKAYGKQRSGRGFSLAELLVVIGIIAVLLMIAVPAVLHYQRELKLTELDDNARAVFMAAQNHLSALRSTSVGDLEVSAAVGREAQDVPGAAVPSLGAETKLKYVATDIEKADPNWLVLPGSIEVDISQGSYLVEFDPASGAVYGVFFMEKSGSHALDGSVYPNIGTSCRVRDGRRSFAKDSGLFVGYYGADGELDITRPEVKKLPTPKLTLVNAEELRLDISADSVSDALKSKLRVDVTATDGTNTKALVEGAAFQVGDVGRVVLDTLHYDPNKQVTGGWKKGKSFQEWMGDVITPGADITLTVSIWYQPDAGEGIAALPTSASVKTNSLFASRNDNTVKVAYGRHLENLNATGLDSAITAAEQIKTIDFAAEGAGDNVYYWAKTYGAEFPFVPIKNTHLSSFDGGNLVIKNLYAVKASGRYENAGLFDSFTVKDSILKNVVLEDAQVRGKTAGSLAGFVMNATVDNCRAYILTNPGATTYSATVRVDGTTYAGGLIGQCVNSTIGNGSFAATVVSGTSSVGGLVGQGGNLKVNQCYAAGHLSGGTVGGMVGTGNARLENCYTAGTIFKASSMAAGLIASPNQVVRSYAAVDYVTVPAPAADGTARVYGAAPVGSGCTNVYYLVKPGVNSAGVGVAVSSSQQMKKSAGLAGLGSAFVEGGSDSVPAFPYNLPNTDAGRDPELNAPYPYPTLKVGEETVEHYGDWLVNEGSAFLAYYEKYTDGSYGYYYFDPQKPEAAAYNTLRGDSDGNYGAVVEEGYGVLGSSEPSLTDATNGAVTLSEDTAATLTIEEKTYTLFTLDGAWLQSHHGYQTVTVSGQKVYVNPDFAKTVSLTEKNTATATDYAVRSVRQLDNIDALGDYASKSFTQELEIDGVAFAGTLYGKNVGDWKTFPVQYADRPFTGTFVGGMDKGGKGKSAKIMHLDIKNSGSAGLFGTIGTGAAVRDVAMASVSVTAESGDAGSLAAVISGGTVSNCGVWVVTDAGETKNAPYDTYTVQANNGGAGGFAGKITGGTVDKCFAAVKVTAKTSGGFVSRLSGGTVSNSYAAGHTVDGVFEDPVDGKSANITGSSVAAGFVGDWTAGTISGTCYTTLSVDGGASGTVGAFAAVHPSGVKLSGCYAKSYVYSGGALVNPADVTDLGLDTSAYKGVKGIAYPYDNTLAEEYDFKPIPGLDHYGDWSLKKLRGLVAYYEQIELSTGTSGNPDLKTEFFYYDRVKNDSTGHYELVEKGTLDKTRTGTLYSDGYAFLSLNKLHKTGEENKPVTLKVDIGGTATLENMAEHPTTYLGSYNADLTPFVEKHDGTKPFYYAYGLPNTVLDASVDAENYFLQLKVAGLDSEVEQSSLWLNPHFGRAAYNGYGETNPHNGTPQIPVPNATSGTIAIRSIRQFNNMRKYSSSIRDWKQELDIDATQYKGHPEQDAEGYLTLGGLRVVTQQADGTWAPVACSAKPTVADIPANYRLAMDSITMHSQDAEKDGWGGTYDGGKHPISGLNIGSVTGATKSNPKRYYAGLFCHNKGVLKNVLLTDSSVTGYTGSDNNFTGGLAGYSEGDILNCSVNNCTITHTGTGKKSNVGGLVGYVRKGTIGLDGSAEAPCTVINCMVDGGSAVYTGGFIGYVRDGKVENCGVRVEDATIDRAKWTAATLYDTRMVKGDGNTGGFVGGMQAGAVQYSHASVKVRGGVAGGFAGTMTGGTIHNSYAAGHTKRGTYVASDPNVTTPNTTGRAGGFVGEWKAGNITGTCYTTCSVNGPEHLTGAFSKSYPDAGLDMSNCYAAGYVYINGERTLSLEGAVGGLGDRVWSGTKVAAKPYDKLPKEYDYKPTTDAAGQPMVHIGDWEHAPEWIQKLPEIGVDPKQYDTDGKRMTADAQWKGDTLTMTFTVENPWNNGDPFLGMGSMSSGNYIITTDLGYSVMFHPVANGDGTYRIESNISGLEMVRLDPGTGEGQDPTHSIWTIKIPTSSLPPYTESISIGISGDKYLAEVKNTDPSDPAYQPVEPFDQETMKVKIDGNFSEWKTYEHQIIDYSAWGNAAPIAGQSFAAMLGDGDKIYIHVYTRDPSKLTPNPPQKLSDVKILQMYLETEGYNNWALSWWNTGLPLTEENPGHYSISQGDTSFGELYLSTSDELHEAEMVIDLAKCVGAENTGFISRVKATFGGLGTQYVQVDRNPAYIKH